MRLATTNPMTHHTQNTHPFTRPKHTGTGVALTNAATSVKCERRAEVQHLHANELGPKGQLFDAVCMWVYILFNMYINMCALCVCGFGGV